MDYCSVIGINSVQFSSELHGVDAYGGSAFCNTLTRAKTLRCRSVFSFYIFTLDC